MNAYMLDALREVIESIRCCLDGHEAETIETLRLVADGELEMVETLTPEEEVYARALFGWIASQGPKRVFKKLQPVLANPAHLLEAEILLSAIIGDPGFAVIPPELKDPINQRTLLRLAVLLMSYICYDQFHYPQPETGVYDISDNPFEKVKWVYRYWLNQLEVAEEGSGLEAFFAAQSLTRLTRDAPAQDSDAIVPVFRTVSLSCAGDLLAVDVLTPKNTKHLFDDITDFYSTADIVSANLESTVDEREFIGRYQAPGEPAQMNTSEEMFDKFRHDAKINFFSTATNHALDWGESGVQATLDVLRRSGARYSGTANSQAEQDDVVIVTKNGLRIALLCYTFDLNGHDPDANKSYLANVVRFNDVDPDYSLIKQQVATAKAKGADWIVAYCHWGWEFEMYPHGNIVEAAHRVIECGVDTILGNHAHVSQPAQLIPRPGKQDALVIYAFGDFVSFHPDSRNSKLAYIIKFNIGKLFDEAYVYGIEALPIYIVNEKLGEDSYNCRIVKFAKVLEDPDRYGLTELEKRQLPHLNDKVWGEILSPLSGLK